MAEMKRAELSENMLNEVAGGVDAGKLIKTGTEIATTVMDLVKKGKEKKQDGGKAPAAPGGAGGNTQTNKNDHGVQFASQVGDNNNTGGIVLGK